MSMKFSAILFLFALAVSACVPGGAVDTDMLPSPVLQEYQDFGYYLTWSPDDELIAVTANTGLYVYDSHTFRQVAAFSGLSGSTVDFSSNYMAAINSEGLYVWN